VSHDFIGFSGINILLCYLYVSCCLGCTKNDEFIFSAHDLLHDLPGDYNIVKCRTCGLMRTNPRPTPESIGFYYPEDYRPYLGTVVQMDSGEPPATIKRFLKPLVNWVFNFKGTVLPALATGRMLEVGCASGSYLHQMAGKGWLVQGLESSQIAAQSARELGYHVHSGTLETAPAPDEPFDLIVGWMVLEHLYDPVFCLKKLSRWAKPDAWLVLSIPNAASLEFRLFKNNGYALQVPTHLHHFTPHSVGKVLQAGGWRMEKVHHQRTLSNLIGSLGYLLRDNGFTKLGKKLIEIPDQGSPLVYVLFPLAWLLSLFGQTGRMTVWARKI